MLPYPRLGGFVAAFSALFLPGIGLAADASADREQGRKLFDGMCANCHGFAGAGGNAPSLMRAKLERAPDDAALRDLLNNGIPERGMPPARRLSDSEQRQIVAYVRSLGTQKLAPIPGDAGKGAEVYQRNGCATCHIIRGQGGGVGPELTQIGQMRGLDYLRQSVVDPGATLPVGNPSGITNAGGGFSRFLPVRVVTRDGREIQGYRVNEDTFALQIRELDGQLHSFRKSELRQIEKQPGTSLMPAIGKQLDPGEVDNLVAYLAGLGRSL